MSKLEEAANEYAKKMGDDCLCQRTRPGTPVGEHPDFFCGCYVYGGFVNGAKWAFEQAARVAEREANSFEADKSGDYRDGHYLTARRIWRALLALASPSGELEGGADGKR